MAIRKPRLDYGSLLRSPEPGLWHRLEELSKRYDYDPNHNLRYIELARAIQREGVTHIVVLGSGRCVLESLLPSTLNSLSIDINRKDLAIGAALTAGATNRVVMQADIFHLPFKSFYRTQMVIVSEVLEHVERDYGILAVAHDLLESGGKLLLTVPNLARFINQIVVALGGKEYFMSEDHLREYTLPAILQLLDQAGFTPLWLVPIYLRLAKELWLRKWFVRLRSPIRNLLLLVFPGFATYYLILAKKV